MFFGPNFQILHFQNLIIIKVQPIFRENGCTFITVYREAELVTDRFMGKGRSLPPPESARRGDQGPSTHQISQILPRDLSQFECLTLHFRVEKFGVSMAQGPPAGPIPGGETVPLPHKFISQRLSLCIHSDKGTSILMKYWPYFNYNRVSKM